MGNCCCLTQKQGDHSSAVEEMFPHLLEQKVSAELQGWLPCRRWAWESPLTVQACKPSCEYSRLSSCWSSGPNHGLLIAQNHIDQYICQGCRVEAAERSQVQSEWRKDGGTTDDHPVCSNFSLLYIVSVYGNLLWIVFSHSRLCGWSHGSWGDPRKERNLFSSGPWHWLSWHYSRVQGGRKVFLDVAEAPFCDFSVYLLYLNCYFTGFAPDQCTGIASSLSPNRGSGQVKGDTCHNQYLWLYL